MSELKNTFTIKITLLDTGEVDVWTKGMPDTRSFGGKLISELPVSHALGLDALAFIMDSCDRVGLKMHKRENTK